MNQNFKQIVTKEFILLNICFMTGFSPVFLFYLFPIYLTELGARQYQIGIAMGCFAVGGLVTKPFVGDWMDRGGGKKMAQAGYVISTLALLSMFFSGSIPTFYLLRFFFGIGVSICSTGLYTLMIQISPKEMIGQAIGIFGIANFVVAGGATVLGEYLLRRFNFQAIIFTSIGMLILSSMMLSLVRKVEIRKEAEETTHFFKTIIGPVMPYFIASFVFAAIHGALFSFISVYLVESKYKWISFFFVFYSTGAILLRIFFGHLVDKVSKAFIITASFMAYGCSILILTIFTTSYIVLFSAFLLGISHGFLYPALNTGIIKIIGEKKHGTGTNIFFLAFDTGIGIAPFLFGFLSGYLGYRFSFLTASVLLILFSFVVYKPLNRVSH